MNIQHHYSSLQCHVILQKSFYYADLLLKKHLLLLSLLASNFWMVYVAWSCSYFLLWCDVCSSDFDQNKMDSFTKLRVKSAY